MKIKKLNEQLNLEDGWPKAIEELDAYDVLNDVYKLQYEIENTYRGYYSNADTYEKLADYIRGLCYNLDIFADNVEALQDNDNLVENKIADKIIKNQNKQEMTKRAIQTLKARGGKYDDLVDEYEKTYGEKVFKEGYGVDYLERELSKKTDRVSIKDAYDTNDLTIVKPKDRNVYYIERCPSRLFNIVIKEMKKYFPELRYLYDECLHEDTIKTKSGKWVNKGDTGETHGEFRTKKEADAQRRAIFANWKK